MIRDGGTSDFAALLATPQGVRAATKWFLRLDIFAQFSLNKEMETHRKRKAGRCAGNDVDDG